MIFNAVWDSLGPCLVIHPRTLDGKKGIVICEFILLIVFKVLESFSVFVHETKPNHQILHKVQKSAFFNGAKIEELRVNPEVVNREKSRNGFEEHAIETILQFAHEYHFNRSLVNRYLKRQ